MPGGQPFFKCFNSFCRSWLSHCRRFSSFLRISSVFVRILLESVDELYVILKSSQCEEYI